jgi:hypothetical protein
MSGGFLFLGLRNAMSCILDTFYRQSESNILVYIIFMFRNESIIRGYAHPICFSSVLEELVLKKSVGGGGPESPSIPARGYAPV